MNAVQIQKATLKTHSLGIHHKLSQMRQKELDNRHNSCINVLNRLIALCVLLALAAQGTGKVTLLL